MSWPNTTKSRDDTGAIPPTASSSYQITDQDDVSAEGSQSSSSPLCHIARSENTISEGLLPASLSTREGQTMKTEVGGCIALPPEIRDRIYRYLLGPPGTPIAHRIVPKFFYKPVDNLYWIESRSFEEEAKFPDYCQFEPSCLSILLVSKQTYAEAFHLFYCANLFEFQDTADLFRFLKIIGYARRQHLKMIRFDWHGPQAKEAFRLLKTCQWLEVVHFTVPCSHPPGYAALKEVRGLKIARAEAMVHYNRDPNHCYIHFGDYHCHCRCRKDGDLLSDLKELETAMMRHRLKKYAPKEEEKINLFKAKRENFKKSEDDLLVEGKASFDQQWRRLEERVWRSTHAT